MEVTGLKLGSIGSFPSSLSKRHFSASSWWLDTDGLATVYFEWLELDAPFGRIWVLSLKASTSNQLNKSLRGDLIFTTELDFDCMKCYRKQSKPKNFRKKKKKLSKPKNVSSSDDIHWMCHGISQETSLMEWTENQKPCELAVLVRLYLSGWMNFLVTEKLSLFS